MRIWVCGLQFGFVSLMPDQPARKSPLESTEMTAESPTHLGAVSVVIGVQLDCAMEATRAPDTVAPCPAPWCATTSAAPVMPVTIAAATAIHARRWVPLRRRIAILPIEAGIVVLGVENATQGNICPQNAEPVRNGRAGPVHTGIKDRLASNRATLHNVHYRHLTHGSRSRCRNSHVLCQSSCRLTAILSSLLSSCQSSCRLILRQRG